jgi:hypothetical protein
MKKKPIKIKLTKGVISREEAIKISPEYVSYIETHSMKDWDKIDKQFSKLKKGQEVLTSSGGVFVKAKISSMDYDSYQAVDGPVVRVSNGEYSWRVDGDAYAVLWAKE